MRKRLKKKPIFVVKLGKSRKVKEDPVIKKTRANNEFNPTLRSDYTNLKHRLL